MELGHGTDFTSHSRPLHADKAGPEDPSTVISTGHTVLETRVVVTLTRLEGLYLWEGTGDPCAGHTKLKDFPSPDLNFPRVSELEENLGAEVPTGSRRDDLRDVNNEEEGNPRAVSCFLNQD